MNQGLNDREYEKFEEVSSKPAVRVSAVSSVLPSGASTADNQTNGNQKTQVIPLTTLYNGTKTAPTATAEVLASSQAISSVTIKALSTNLGIVYVGASGVTTSNGFELLAGESVSLDIDNLSDVYVIGSTSSQVVRYIAL